MLQKITLQILSVIVLGTLPQNVFAITTIESKIQKFDLKTCPTKLKCLHITAASANSSQFLPLYVLKNVKVEIIDEKIIESDSGYINFSQNLIVLNLKNGDEVTLDLQTLEEKNFAK